MSATADVEKQAFTKAASPVLEWSNPPAGTKSFALIMHDVDFAPGKGSMDVTHYIIELFALDTDLNLPAGSTRTELLDAMNGHVLGKAGYVGRFGR